MNKQKTKKGKINGRERGNKMENIKNGKRTER